MTDRPRIIAVVGPTAVGKSGLALRLAESLGGEIISVDSAQVYRGFDIGTAKATAAERARVPHHGIDIRDPAAPGAQYTAADFAADADGWIADIVGRDRVPILAGGTGLYLRSLVQGLSDAPPADEAVRARIDAAWVADRAATWDRLRSVDPGTASFVHANDRVRVVRALEVYEITGSSMTRWREDHGLAEERVDAAVVALTAPRAELYARIDGRTRQMLDAGLVDEVQALLDAGVPRTAPPMTAIGYRQVLDALDGEWPRAELERVLARDTRHYAKRQLTWFRKHPGTRWFDARAVRGDGYASLVDALRRFLDGAPFDAGHADERAVSEPANVPEGSTNRQR